MALPLTEDFMTSPPSPPDPKPSPQSPLGSGSMAIPLENSDGRHARRDRGKQSALEAAVQIFRDGGVIESMAQLAEKSGISERTLFRYFTNQDGLIDAVAKYIFPQLTEYFTLVVPDLPLKERMRALVDLRVSHTQIAAPMARTIERYMRQFSIAAELRSGRDAIFHEQLLRWLGDDAKDLNEVKIALIETLIDFNSLDKLLATLGPRTNEAVHKALMILIND